MDTPWEIRMEMAYEAKEQEHIGKMESCNFCPDHNDGCPYYDADEESWDFEQCFRENDW